MRRILSVGLMLLAGCGTSETEFISDYVTQDCDYAMACYNPSELEFRGWTDAGVCVAAQGPELTGRFQGCAFDKKAAKDCLKEYKKLAETCPADGVDPTPPEVCGQVFDCSAGDTDAGADTDVSTDTDA